MKLNKNIKTSTSNFASQNKVDVDVLKRRVFQKKKKENVSER